MTISKRLALFFFLLLWIFSILTMKYFFFCLSPSLSLHCLVAKLNYCCLDVKQKKKRNKANFCLCFYQHRFLCCHVLFSFLSTYSFFFKSIKWWLRQWTTGERERERINRSFFLSLYLKTKSYEIESRNCYCYCLH